MNLDQTMMARTQSLNEDSYLDTELSSANAFYRTVQP